MLKTASRIVEAIFYNVLYNERSGIEPGLRVAKVFLRELRLNEMKIEPNRLPDAET